MAHARVMVSRRRVSAAVRKAKKLYADKRSKRSAAWKKGGREYARVLGHFGTPVRRKGNRRP